MTTRGATETTTSTYVDGKDATLVVRGDLDLAAAPILDQAPQSVPPHVRVVHVDLGEVPFVDLAGLDGLRGLQDGVRRRSAVMCVHAPPPSMIQLLDLLRWEDVFRLVGAAAFGRGRRPSRTRPRGRVDRRTTEATAGRP